MKVESVAEHQERGLCFFVRERLVQAPWTRSWKVGLLVTTVDTQTFTRQNGSQNNGTLLSKDSLCSRRARFDAAAGSIQMEDHGLTQCGGKPAREHVVRHEGRPATLSDQSSL